MTTEIARETITGPAPLMEEPIITDRPACRTGCKTQNHKSYAECLQSANIQIGSLK